MRTGPNSKKRNINKKTAKSGRLTVSASLKIRKARTPQHTAQWWEHEAKKGRVARCSTCGAYFIGDHWLFVSKEQEKKFHGLARGATCPACASERAHGVAAAEGELRIVGLAEKDRPAVLQLIAAFTARERSRNPEARVLSIDVRKADLRVLTTQNHLAVRLGKKLSETMKGGKLDITYSKDDFPARAVWTAPWRT